MKKFWQIRASTDKKSADLLLYGYISETSWWGDEVTPKQFAEDLKAVGDVDILNVYINSNGGDVFAGQAIHSQLKRHTARVVVHIDGLAASIASVVAMAGDEVIMPSNAMMMIHNPATWAGWSDARELRELAEVLDNVRKSLIAAYRDKTGLSDEEIIQLMDDETWFTAEEAVEKGFADRVEQAQKVAAALRGDTLIVAGREFDIGRFSRFPRERIAAVVQAPPEAPQKKGVTSTVELTPETLKRDHVAVYEAVRAEGYQAGIQAERARMQAIDEIALAGAEGIVQKARYETGATAEQVALEIVKAEKVKAAAYLAGVSADAAALAEVKAGAVPATGEANAAELKSAQEAFAKGANERRGK